MIVAIEATPSCIDHGVRAIDALGRKVDRNPIHCIRIGFHGFKGPRHALIPQASSEYC